MNIRWARELLIDGTFEAGEAASVEIPSPSTEQILTEVAAASSAQCRRAIEAARRAFDEGSWADDASKRAQVLHRLADLIEANAELLAQAATHEVGTPITTSREIQVGAPITLLRWFAGATQIDRTEDFGGSAEPVPSHSVLGYRPVGVVAAVTAYNYPLQLAVAKVGAALAAGCTAVLMPSPLAPLTTLLLAELAQEAGVPPGVLNVIVGDADIGRQLTSAPEVDKTSFTGSVAVGRQVMVQAAGAITDVVLELGGKSAAILLPDVDLAAIVPVVHARYLRNAGQGCQSNTRLLVHRDKIDEFVDYSRAYFDSVAVGDPFDPATWVGPVIRAAHRDRIEGYVREALANGSKILAGGGRPSFDHGWWVNPTLIGDVTNDARISREELFGPVAVVIPYRTVEEAVALANDSEYGLHTYVFGELDTCLALAPRFRSGSVTINGGGGFRPDLPMGGFKKSGIGREWGEAGIREFLEPQHVQWAVPRKEPAPLPTAAARR